MSTPVIIRGTIASNVTNTNTFTASYPSGYSEGDFIFSSGHKISIGSDIYSAPDTILVAFGDASITITNNSGRTFAAGEDYILGVNMAGTTPVKSTIASERVKRTAKVQSVLTSFGTPITADADGVSASQSVAAAASFLINGALASSGSVTFDVPRNVVAAWTGTAVVTVNGYDEYGNKVTESSASGTSLTGVKAFKRVVSVTSSASITSATVGSGVTLGMPMFLPDADLVIKEFVDGAVVTNGVFVVGSAVKPLATTADVRGTYTPNSAPDGNRRYTLLLSLPDPGALGGAHYSNF